MNDKTFLLRLPADLHEWLKKNAKEGMMNEFILEAIHEKISRETKETADEHFEEKDLLDCPGYSHLKIRSRWTYGRYSKQFMHAENTVLDQYYPEQRDIALFESLLKDIPEDEKQRMIEEYFTLLAKMPWSESKELVAYFREQDERRNLGGDPREIVWKNLTRKDILQHLPKDKSYTAGDVAAALGVSYMQAYNHIVPWLRNQGYKITRG